MANKHQLLNFSVIHNQFPVYQALFVKSKNPNHARHCLAMQSQKEGESVEVYLLALEKLAKEYDFKAVTAVLHQEESNKNGVSDKSCILACHLHCTFTNAIERFLKSNNDKNGILD